MLKNLFKNRIKENSIAIDDLLTIDDLKKNQTKIHHISQKDKRNVKIVFLDDEGFDTDLLKNLGYLDVHKMYKFNEMDDFEKFDIIFCDINGIAKEIDETFQGAALAKMIKETYPEKVVIIFSAKQQYLTFNDYGNYVDDVIYKNITISELSEKINHYIDTLINPINFWENIRKQLISQNVSTKEISKLEHFYVKSMLDNKDYSKAINEYSNLNKLDFATSIINAITAAIGMYLSIRK